MSKSASDQNWILTYYQAIRDGSVTVGRWIRLLYEYIIKGLEDEAFFFDQKKANQAVDWIEAHCFHVKGPLAPGRLTLDLWQKAMISCMFGLVNHLHRIPRLSEAPWEVP